MTDKGWSWKTYACLQSSCSSACFASVTVQMIRVGVLYLEDVSKLPMSAHDIHQNLLTRKFIVSAPRPPPRATDTQVCGTDH